tara:strand:- start:210 stop:464 length:255 start_codon:yes stop_codon:yes gene_type:complete
MPNKEKKSVKDFWGENSERQKLIEFRNAIQKKENRLGDPEGSIPYIKKLIDGLLKEYKTRPEQIKYMLSSAKWEEGEIENVLAK